MVVPSQFTCACPAAIFFHANYETNSSSGQLHWYNLTFTHAWTSNFTVAALRLSIVDANCSAVTGVLSYTLSYLNQSVFAQENGTTGSWVFGASIIVPEGDLPSGGMTSGYLSITSITNLTPDRLASAYVPQNSIEDLSALRPGYVAGTGIGSGWECGGS